MGDRWIISSDVRRWCRGPAGAVALILVCLSVYLPGIATIAPIDRDESRFAQASRQMFEAAALPPELKRPALHDGGWAVPKVQDRPRLNKPPLIYWLQVASAWTFTGGDPQRDAIWMYRVPSIVCSTVAVLATWWFGRSMFDPRAAWAGAAMLAIAPVVVFDAHQARADQLLLATIVGAQGYLWRVWHRSRQAGAAARAKPPGADPMVTRDSRGWIGLWICLGVSVLAKGPIGPLIALLTCAALSVTTRRWSWLRNLRPLPGAAILAVMVAPWVWMVGDHVGWQNYALIVYDETVGRSIQAKEGHWAPPGYHTLLLAVLLWPGSLTTALGIKRAVGLAVRSTEHRRAGRALDRARAWWRTRTPGRDAQLFCLAWILPAWVVFELIGTKLPHYTLPLYPPIALLSARMLLRAIGRGRLEHFSALDRFGFGAWWFLGIVVSHGGLLGIILLGFAVGQPGITTMTAAMVALLPAFAAWRIRPSHDRPIDARRPIIMALVWVAASGLFMAFLARHLLPGSQTPRLVALAKGAGGTAALIASEYHEDSLIFATRGLVQRVDRDATASWLGAGEGRVAIVRAGGSPFFDDSGEVLPPYVSWGGVGEGRVGTWRVITREPALVPDPGGGAP